MNLGGVRFSLRCAEKRELVGRDLLATCHRQAEFVYEAVGNLVIHPKPKRGYSV